MEKNWIKCPIGWYDPEKDIFLVDNFEIVTVTPQDLADCISLAHTNKVKRDNEIKKSFAK